MHITCPYCGFSKNIDRSSLPVEATRATCPKCQQSFSLEHEKKIPDIKPDTTEELYGRNLEQIQTSTKDLPKAGFWMRTAATLIDALIVFVLQSLLGALLAFAGFSTAGLGHEPGGIALILQLFAFAFSFAYYIFFLGYCGQTPGKMALRIKVIRCNGSQLSYARAAFREIPAKFISGIILGIGYLMVAFDEQKQGLHDRMADTYVIKL